MKLLIERGAKVDRPDLHGRTPLSWAAEHCQLTAAQLLVRYGAEVNAEDDEWITPLSWLLYADEGNVRHGLHDYLVSKGAKRNLDHAFWDRLKYSLRARWSWIHPARA
jgi:ankyrin repeat protein